MTKKILILLLAISMVCSSLFAAFALDGASVNEGGDQPSGITTKDESEATSTKEAELNNEAQGEEATTDEESLDVEETNAPRLQSAPQQGANPEEKITVELVGMWVGESSQKINKPREYDSLNSKIGMPEPNLGLLRGLAKIFLAWSDKPTVNNGHLAPGARYFSPEDTLETAFPNGVPEDAKLYGVYFSLVGDDDPLPGDPLSALQIGNLANKFSKLINETEVNINYGMSAGDTRPDTGIGKGNYKDTVDGNVSTILDHYKYDVNNIVNLTSEFYMDPTIALITYRNPIGSNQLKPILSRDYDQRKKNGDFPTKDGREAGYTYVDLNVNLDEDFEIPDVLYLEFFGYSWRPLYVMDKDKNLLEILNPNDDKPLGSGPNSFNTLVNDTNPRVTFGVKTNGSSKITVRVILRESEMEKILEENITPDEGKTIMETILSNMTLKCLPKTNLRISDEKARELAKTNGEETLLVNGNVKGHMFVHAGKYKKGWFTFTLASDTAITETKSNDLKLGYVPNNVFYKFVSGTKDKTLPNEIMAKLPKDRLIQNKDGVLDKDKVALSAYDDVKVSGGVWTFQSWYVTNDQFENDPNLKAVSKEALINSPDDLHLLGVWVFKENPKVVKENPKSVQTGDTQSIYLAIALAITCLAGIVAIRFKKSK